MLEFFKNIFLLQKYSQKYFKKINDNLEYLGRGESRVIGLSHSSYNINRFIPRQPLCLSMNT